METCDDDRDDQVEANEPQEEAKSTKMVHRVKRQKIMGNDDKKSKQQSQQPKSQRRRVTGAAHHIRHPLCTTRPGYRRGKRETAVKAYTIADESIYILVRNVPRLSPGDSRQDLLALCERYGSIESLEAIDYDDRDPNPDRDSGNSSFDTSRFYDTFLLKYATLVDAIRAKKRLDDHVLLGSQLHCCYAPEFETVRETAAKLDARQRYVAIKLAQFKNMSRIER